MAEDSQNGNGNGKTKTKKNDKPYKDCTEQFDQLIKAIPPTAKVAIFSHRCPDPDAVSSMMGMKWFLYKKYKLESEMFYDGEVAHPQNTAMCNLLDPGMKRVTEEYDPAQYDFHILLDTVPENAGVATFRDKIKFDVCIDHHREYPHEYSGLFIHMKIGACASIVYHLIQKLTNENERFEDDVDNDTKVVTALIAGIMTDTNMLLSDDTTEYDRQAFNDLFEYRDSSALHKIVFFKRPKFWIDKKAAGCSEATVDEEGYAIVGLGIVPEKQRDLIADMAEEMVSWASVETAIAFAVVGGERLEGSVRSLNASVSVPDLCKKLAGKRGMGGGKHGKGAYRISLSPEIDPDEDEADVQEAWESIKKREAKRIARLIKK